MKNSQTLFLKSVIVLVAIAVIAAMIWFPQTEGRAVNLDLISIYKDPFIIYAYIASIPFFVALYNGFTLLNDIEQNKIFSQHSVVALKNIKYCALALIGFLIAGGVYIRFGVNEDGAGAIALGIYITVLAIIVASAAGLFQKLLQNVVDRKSENDLTV